LWRPGGASTQPASFCVTGEIKTEGARGAVACGRLDDTLRAFAKRGLLQDKDVILPDLLRWNGFHVDRGPWYYIENSTYWLQRHLRAIGQLPPPIESWLQSTRESDKADDAKALDYFKSTIVFGALDDDAIPPIPEMPRGPDATDEYVYDRDTVQQRHAAWVKRCEALVSDAITPWLKGRLPRLMALFEADMVRWFGPDILVPSDNQEQP
jgi:hypothetical protein